MEKIKRKKVAIIVIAVFLVLATVSVHFITVIAFGDMDQYILTHTDIYIPSKIPLKYHHSLFSIDTFDYWVFKLNSSEKEKMAEDITDPDWSIMDNNHIEKLSEFNYFGRIIKSSSKNNKCYICIYDIVNMKVITNDEGRILDSCSNWVILLYDADSNYYYCIHESY